jgi:hypothetical protein
MRIYQEAGSSVSDERRGSVKYGLHLAYSSLSFEVEFGLQSETSYRAIVFNIDSLVHYFGDLEILPAGYVCRSGK